MKTLRYFTYIFILLSISCGSSKNKVTQAEINFLETLVQNKQFKIESTRAYPRNTWATQQVLNSGLLPPDSNSGSVNLIGNPNFLTISGDSISSYLPYFGERQMNIGYGGRDGAIELEGIVSDYTSEKNKDNSYDIRFEAKSKTENYNVYIKLWPSLNSDITINSSSRFPIRYTGNVEVINE
jgi:hypothetical protein